LIQTPIEPSSLIVSVQAWQGLFEQTFNIFDRALYNMLIGQ